MASYKQSTAYTRMFKMIDSADHFSKKTGLTCTVNISKAGAAFGAAGGTVTEVANGWYKIALTTTDSNTLGDLAFYITAAGADDTDFVDQVVAIDALDAVHFGLTAIPNAAAGASGGLLISGSNAGTTTLAALTVTGALTVSDGIAVTRSTSNGSAITATGNGTGSGIIATSGSGATGDGVKAVAASADGNGLTLTKAGTGKDFNATSTPLTLAKTTNLTGLNDIAAGAAMTLTAGERTAVATAHWQDATVGDFTVAGSIGKSLFTSGNAPGVASGIALVGSNMGTVSTVTGNVNGSTASIGANGLDAAALATDAVNEIRDAVFARAFSAAYGSYTFDELMKMIAAVLLAKASGLSTGPAVYRNLADSADVVSSVGDSDGNRTAVTRTP